MSIKYVNEKKDSCCGCGACASICTKNAITMSCDEDGFTYPIIDKHKCNQCHLCNKVCLYNNKLVLQTPLQCFAAATVNNQTLLKSSSGGIFTTIAKQFIETGGIVVGVSFKKEKGELICEHIAVSNPNYLSLLQGSKYVQSKTDNIFRIVKEYLQANRKVLFSGTPCQIASLKLFLRKDYDTLFTIDVICHGVPNSKLFNDYLKTLKVENIENFSFRDKQKKGWGMYARVDYKTNKKEQSKFFYSRTSSYFSFFLDGKTYRKSCYTCLFAKEQRISDMTLGDYWGFAKEHPDYIKRYFFDESKGISCVLVNTKKGQQLLEDINDEINICDTTLESIKRQNNQLSHPTQYKDEQKIIFQYYREYGYQGVEKYYKKKYWLDIFFYRIFDVLPKVIKNLIKNIKNCS